MYTTIANFLHITCEQLIFVKQYSHACPIEENRRRSALRADILLDTIPSQTIQPPKVV